MVTVAQLLVKLNADTAAAEFSLARVGKMLGPGGALGLPVLLGTAAVAGIGIVATKMAGDFQASTEQIVTGAGLQQSSIEMVRAGILKMAVDTGTSTKQLSEGMFMVSSAMTSAGFTASQELDILRAAAEGAKVGGADLGTTANAVTTVMTDFGLGANQAAMATNVLVATVADGKTHMEDLAGAMSHILPAAAAAHISLSDTMGAMAAMTGQGIDAANAATYLRQMLLALNAPSAGAKKALADIGLTSDQVADEMHKSLPAALALIQQHLKEHYKEGSPQYVEALKNISGGLREMQGMLALTGPHLKTFADDAADIAAKAKAGGGQVAGWAETQKTMNLQMDRAKEVAETLMIQLGQKLLPAATNLFRFLADTAIPDIKNFISWISGSSVGADIFKGVLIALGGAIAAILVVAFVSWAIAAGAAAIATIAATWPILVIGAAIALLIAGIILLVSHWKGIAAWLGSVWHNVQQDVHIGLLLLGDAFGAIGKTAQQVWGGIQTAVKGGINTVIGDINSFIGFIDSIQIHIPAIGVGSVHTPAFDWNGVGIPQIPMLAAGGTITSPGAVLVGEQGAEMLTLPAGAQVTPLSARGGNGTGQASGGQPIVVNLVVDGRRMAQVVVPYIHAIVRNATGRRDM